jgi:hypothetical protein
LASADVARRPRAGLLREAVSRWEEAIEWRWATPVVLAALIALSLFIRTRQLNAGFWIDEGISVGLAHHHWWSIPSLLRQDGSPPAYYMLLGLWIRAFGDSERATHTLSLLFGLACIPLAYAAARSLFDRTTGLVCALLATLNPFLTYYAQETRMYELEAFLSFVIAWAYVEGIVRGRRLWAAVLVPSIALMVYSHNWGLFLCLGLAAATVLFVRERLALFGVVALGVALLYAPWLPTLLSQAQHTGAPWSTTPSIRDLQLAPTSVLGGEGSYSRSSAVRRSSPSCASGSAANGRSSSRSRRRRASRSSRHSSRRRSRLRGRRATSPSFSARSCCSQPAASCARSGSVSSR